MQLKSRNILLALFATLAIVFSGCDIVDNPIDPQGPDASGRKVLIEEFTGHLCTFCPLGHAMGDSLKKFFGEDVVIVSLHTGFFATVFAPYNTDFSTPMATELLATMNPLANFPSAMISRVEDNGIVTFDVGAWSTRVGKIITQAPLLTLETSHSYDSSSRLLTVDIDVSYLGTGTTEDNIVVVITEDSIISPQKDGSLPPPGYWPNYVHKHALRGEITPGGTWGDPVNVTTPLAGTTYTKQYSAVLDSNWVAKNCNIVVYVFHNDNSKEIYNVEEMHLQTN